MNHLGKAPVIFAILLGLSFLLIIFRESDKKSTLEFWVFAQTHYEEYQASIPSFEASNPGVTVKLRQVTNIHDKLLAAFLSGIGAPDLAEVEISSVGRFFKNSKKEIPFVDLTERVESSNLTNVFLPARVAPWVFRNRLYGLPHDVHPVVLLYREDVYRDAGIQFNLIETWEDFIKTGRRFVEFDKSQGHTQRYPLMLSANHPGHFWLMLLQNGGGMFDKEGNIIIDNSIAVSTLEFYCQLFHNDDLAIPAFAGPIDSPANFAAMKDGVVLGLLAPDWYIGSIRSYVPELAGKWRAMPLPAWHKNGRRTSTRGGTMIGITKQSIHIDIAWSFARHIYTNEKAFANRYIKTNIIPPIQSTWRNPVFQKNDKYFGGQQLGLLLTKLGAEIPSFYLNPYWAEGSELLRHAVYESVHKIKTPKQALAKVAGDLRNLRTRTP